MDAEARLKEKLRAIEALFAGGATEGERDAAGRARDRITERIAQLVAETPIEWQFTALNVWERRLLVSLAKRYGLKAYRYKGQRRTTLIVKAPAPFLRDVFSPEFQRMSETLHEHLAEVAERVIAEVLDSKPAAEEAPRQLEAFAFAKE